jgi:nicotinamidase-related amidase
MVTALDSVHAADHSEMARRPLEAERCALIVIDIQEKLLPPIFQKEQLVRNAQLLIRAAGILKIPALVSTQYAKGLGVTVPEIASLLDGTGAIDKTLFSCFGSACRGNATRCYCAGWRVIFAWRRRRWRHCGKDTWCT